MRQKNNQIENIKIQQGVKGKRERERGKWWNCTR